MRMSHKTGIICKANIFTGEGEVQILYQFHGLDPLMKADLLSDWVQDIQDLYEKALEDIKVYGRKSE